MKAIFYTPMSLNYGGGCENWFSELSNILINKYNMQIDIIDTNFIPIKRWSDKEVKGKIKNVKHYRINEFVRNNILLPKVHNIKEIANIFKEYDLLYFNFSFIFQDILMYLVKRKVKKPMICGIHAPLFFENKIHNTYVKLITKRVLKKFDAIHVLNDKDKNIMKKWGIKKVYYIPSGSNTDDFKLKKFKKTSRLKFLFVGRLAEQKGVDILVEGIKRFLEENPEAKVEFNIVGSGEKRRLVEELAKNDKVNYLGFVDDIVKIYQNNDVLLAPSRQETFGLIITEANSCGLPVISSNIPGPNKLILNGKNGWFLKELNAKELANKIQYVYNKWRKDYKFIIKKGIYGRKFVENNFSVSNTAKGFNKMFKEVLKC